MRDTRLNRNIIVLALLLSLIFTTSTFGFPTAKDIPHHIHLTWQRDNPAFTITVTWQSIEEGESSIVLYDKVSREENITNYSNSAEGSAHTFPGASGFIHDVELKDLEPETTYYFVCGSEDSWSSEKAFQTAPVGRRNIKFLVGGDSRTNPLDRDLVSSSMRMFNPSFVLFSGDLVNDGTVQEEWDSFFSHIDEHWEGDNGLEIPIVPVLGNHEKNAINYFEQFALPGNEEWFSFDWGPDLHIIALNSEASLEGIETQTEWLKEDLAEHADFPWIIVLLHRNILPSYHDWWLTAINRWVPIWDTYGVDLVVTGHSHNYMRSNPVNLTKSLEEVMPSYSEGILYISSGGWGAPLYETREGWWVGYTESLLHFTLIDLYANGTLHVQAKDVDGATFDEVQIYKELPEIGELMAGRLIKSDHMTDSLLIDKSLLEEKIEMLEVDKNKLEKELFTADQEIIALEDEIETLNTKINEYRVEVNQTISAKEILEESKGELETQLDRLLSESEDLSTNLTNKTNQMMISLGVAAIAVLSVFIMFLRNRSD